MIARRGDVVLVPIRFSSGQAVKTRPVVVVQSDHNNVRLQDTIVAVITSNVRRVNQERTQLLIAVASSNGQQSGLLQDSAVTCERLHTIRQADIHRRIGSLAPAIMQQLDACLKVALGLPS